MERVAFRFIDLFINDNNIELIRYERAVRRSSEVKWSKSSIPPHRCIATSIFLICFVVLILVENPEWMHLEKS